MKTTLNNIEKHSPCNDGWKKLLSFLGKTKADDEELSLLTILKSNGLKDALWALKAVDGFDREKRLMACDFAEEVLRLTTDDRCENAIKVSRDFANELATKQELEDAAFFAIHSVAYCSAASSASYAAYCSASDTTVSAAMRKNQIKIFKKYMK